MKNKFDFSKPETLVAATGEASERDRKIAGELKALTDAQGRVLNPANAERVSALRAEQLERAAQERAHLDDNLRPAFMAYINEVLSNAEEASEKEIAEAVNHLKDLCNERAELAVRRKDAYKLYATLRRRMAGTDDREAKDFDNTNIYIMGKKLPAVTGASHSKKIQGVADWIYKLP